MTNNNRPAPLLDEATIARLAASMRTSRFNPEKGRLAPRTRRTKHNNR